MGCFLSVKKIKDNLYPNAFKVKKVGSHLAEILLPFHKLGDFISAKPLF